MAMRKAERLLQLQEILISKNEVLVEDLASQFGVSCVTIRKDLNELESQGYVQRTYGGAVIKQQGIHSFFPRSIIRSEILNFSQDKRYIATIAQQLVHDGDNVFLGCGDTCAAIAQALLNHKANFVTNNILVAAILSTNPHAVVRVTGGTLSGYDRHFLSGDLFTRSMENIYFKYAFLGAAGADIHNGFTTYSDFEHSVCDTVRAVSDTLVFALGSSKFGKTNFMHIGNLNVADLIITDAGIPDEYQQYFDRHGITVLTSVNKLQLMPRHNTDISV